MSLQKRRSNPLHYNGIDLRWSVSVRAFSSPGEGLLVVQAAGGQRLVVRLAINDLWLHGSGDRHAVTPRLVRDILDQATAVGWAPESPGPEWHARLNADDKLEC